MVNDFDRESSATFAVFVNGQNNQAPTAANQTVSLALGVTSATISLLTGCTDPNGGDTPSVYSVGLPQVGSITSWNPTTGVANYTIDQHYASDFFTYVITDGHGGMGIGTVTVTR